MTVSLAQRSLSPSFPSHKYRVSSASFIKGAFTFLYFSFLSFASSLCISSDITGLDVEKGAFSLSRARTTQSATKDDRMSFFGQQNNNQQQGPGFGGFGANNNTTPSTGKQNTALLLQALIPSSSSQSGLSSHRESNPVLGAFLRFWSTTAEYWLRQLFE